VSVCFSPEADLLAGAVVSGVGVDALRHVRHRRYLPLALLPLLFGLHQVVEALAWWGTEGRVPVRVGEMAIWLYLAFAFLVVPPFVPWAVRAAEADEPRRRLLLPFVLLGAVVAAALLPGLLNGEAGGEVACRYIAYDSGVPYSGYLLPFYVVATCGPMLLSGNRRFVLFGMANLLAVALLGGLLARGVISLWCVWAAATSVFIAREVRAAERQTARAAMAAPG
jgi:hypothetical protein